MATSAPSRAYAIAAARPIPESPPVIRAFRPARRPEPRELVSPWSGRGSILLARPGHGCDCALKGGLGYLTVGSCNRLAVGDCVIFSANVGRMTVAARPTPRPPTICRRENLLLSCPTFCSPPVSYQKAANARIWHRILAVHPAKPVSKALDY